MARIFAFMLGIAGALIASQAPEFTVQYMQNLQGRVDELSAIVAAEEAEIREHGYTRETAIAECADATLLLEAFCLSYRGAVERLSVLSVHLKQLDGVEELVRPLKLAQTYDRDIAMSVRSQFEPAVPATAHGIVYTAGGFAVAWGLPLMLFSIIGGLAGGRR